MPRQQPSLLDVRARTWHRRDGRAHPLDRLEVRGETLYYASILDDSPTIRYFERWLIPSCGWMVNRFQFHEHAERRHYDWYVDIDHIEVADGRWRMDDRFLDVIVHEGRGYEVWDADELADGLEQGEIHPSRGRRRPARPP